MIDEDLKDSVYLGDGLYVKYDGFTFWLMTSNGMCILNSVALEPNVLEEFFRFVGRTLKLQINITKIESGEVAE